MTTWKIGCSGFHYKHWAHLFYPDNLAQSKWFEFYCEHFDTVELNVTFYRFPKLQFLESWYKRSPDDFVFAVKAPRLITHFKQFHNADQQLADFYSVISEGLKEKLGCILFQLPPRTAYTPERLERIINSLDPAYKNVVEFRHLSWWVPEVYQTLSKNNITFCGMSHPELPEDIIQNNQLFYYRFHGIPELYKSEYDQAVLKTFTDEIESTGKVKQAFVYFNNDIDGSAITNAKQMLEMAV